MVQWPSQLAESIVAASPTWFRLPFLNRAIIRSEKDKIKGGPPGFNVKPVFELFYLMTDSNCRKTEETGIIASVVLLVVRFGYGA